MHYKGKVSNWITIFYSRMTIPKMVNVVQEYLRVVIAEGIYLKFDEAAD